MRGKNQCRNSGRGEILPLRRAAHHSPGAVPAATGAVQTSAPGLAFNDKAPEGAARAGVLFVQACASLAVALLACGLCFTPMPGWQKCFCVVVAVVSLGSAALFALGGFKAWGAQ